MSLTDEMAARLRVTAGQEADAHETIVALVLACRDAGGSLREIGSIIGRSHTEVARIESRARAGAS